MEDPRKWELKKLINAYCHLEQTRKFHVQRIFAEENRLRKSLASWENTHRRFERLGKLNDFHDLFTETQRQQAKLAATLQTFLDFNPDLKDLNYYKEATGLLEMQKSLNSIADLTDQKEECSDTTGEAVAQDDSLVIQSGSELK